MSIKITYEQLVKQKACNAATSHFAQIFGSETEVTLSSVVEWAEDFDFTWAIINLVDHSDIDEFNSIIRALHPVISAAYRSVSEIRCRMLDTEYGSLERGAAYREWLDAGNEMDKAMCTIDAIVFFLAANAYGLKS